MDTNRYENSEHCTFITENLSFWWKRDHNWPEPLLSAYNKSSFPATVSTSVNNACTINILGALLGISLTNFANVKKVSYSGVQIRMRIGILFSLFLIQNICCGYSKEPSQ